MKNEKVLSKSRIKRGLQCSKSLYFTLFQPELECEVELATQFSFDEGNLVGELAREQFKGGVLIDKAPWDRAGGVTATNEAIAKGVLIIFEASFEAKGIYARVDVLRRKTKASAWELIEVKKSTRVKDDHYEDVAIQALVLQSAGVKVESYSLMHLNSECVSPNLKNLFSLEDVSESVTALLPEIEKKVLALKKMVAAGKEPKVGIGPHCEEPYGCPFKQHCWQGFPESSVFDLPGVGSVAGWKLIASGKVRIADLQASDFKGKTRRAIEVVQSGKRWVDGPAVRKAVGEWVWPLYFLDFETLAPAIPRYVGSTPYGEVPFQFSCHMWRSPDSALEHFEYLHLSADDPRQPLAQALVEGFGKGAKGTVLAYSASVERRIIEGLAEECPTLSEELLAIATRLADPLPVFREFVYDPGFAGSFSIKTVAPAIAGASFGYDDLKVGDGMLARAVAEGIIAGRVNEEEWREALLLYCRQDTRAMVELVRWMLACSMKK